VADSAISVRTAQGEKKIATVTEIDPDFGLVHLFRVSSGGAAPGGGLTDLELRAAAVPVDVIDEAGRMLGHVIVDSMPAGGAGLTDAELRASAVPVSHAGLTDAQLRALAVPVSGTFFPGTQPVSGTFWQVTQPVSGPLTDAALRATPVPISGTFWQATQPVSGAFFQATQPVSGPLTDTQLRASAVPISGALTDVQLRASAVPVSGPMTDAQMRAAAVKIYESIPGRVVRHLFMAAPIVTTVAEVMMSLTGYMAGAAVAPTVTPAVVTAGKVLRLTMVSLSYFNVAAVGSARFTLRANLAGVAVIGSPLVASWQIGQSGDGASTAGHMYSRDLALPEDGLEFAAATGIAVGMQGFGAVPTTGTIVGYGKIELLGYEYTP